jgi:hypothetical protein
LPEAVESRGVLRQEVSALADARTAQSGHRDPHSECQERGRGAVPKREIQSPALSRRRPEEEARHENQEADQYPESRQEEDASDRLVERARDAAEAGIVAAKDLNRLDAVAEESETDEAPAPATADACDPGDQRERQKEDPDSDVEGRRLVQVSLRLHNDPMKGHAEKADRSKGDSQRSRPEEGAFMRVETKEASHYTSPANQRIVTR